MIHHLGITVSDFDVSKSFYDKAMAPLGASLLYMVPTEYTGGAKVGGYGRDRPVFWLSSGKDKPKDHQHLAFTARSRAEVDAFHAAA
ncbi:VOC family protein, partial [bacterium M00.F.Ca.ET.191.01.1.1]